MSIDDNTNEAENLSQSVETIAETVQQTVATPAANAGGNIVAKLLELKDSNPKVFFGGIGAVAVIFLALVMSGGSDPKLPVHQSKPISIGQNYVLKSPNTYDPNATIRMVSVPGSMAAYDDTEENDREGACKHLPQNSSVKLIQSQQDPSDKNLMWVEVEVLDAGECQGKRSWTSGINLQ